MSQEYRNVQRFTDLEVWRKSHELFLQVLFDLDALPNTRAAAILSDQSIRSLGSMGGNIAEGFNRSKAKYLNCLDIALWVKPTRQRTGSTNSVTRNCLNARKPRLTYWK